MTGRGGVVIRELRTPGEFLATMDVSKAAWGFAERSVSPASDLIAATHAGGLTGAAFAGKKMLAFVHGFPRTNLDEPCQYSHLLAVLPEAQGQGLGVALKHFQRDWCLARGIRLVTWMYDPFLVRNATLNLVRLRGTADRFHPDLYGHIGGIYADLPSDRFEVFWRLDAPGAVRAAAGEPPASLDVAGAPVARSPRALPDAPRVLLPFPAGAPRLYRTDPAAARKARRRFAALVQPLFARGYAVTDLVALADGSPAYVLDRRVGA